MDKNKLRQKLSQLQNGQISIDEALNYFKAMPYDDIGIAKIDTHRNLRTGLPEVVFCQGKSISQVVKILKGLSENNDRVLGTRAEPVMAYEVLKQLPDARYNPDSWLISIEKIKLDPPGKESPFSLILTAGTSDLRVAEEAAQTLEFFGNRVKRAYDVGVAGVHRLMDIREQLSKADVIISVAGMEGALTSVVTGLVGCPVIGVPTSVGYGASFEGLSALLTMLNSCAPGVAVVNIDNGFGAAQFAHSILARFPKEAEN